MQPKENNETFSPNRVVEYVRNHVQEFSPTEAKELIALLQTIIEATNNTTTATPILTRSPPTEMPIDTIQKAIHDKLPNITDEKIWNAWSNEPLKIAIGTLSNEEKKIIESMAAALVRDCSNFTITASKPIGDPKTPDHFDHCSFRIRETSQEHTLSELSESLKKCLPNDAQLLMNHGGDMSTARSILLLNHPNDPSKTIILYRMLNPGGASSLCQQQDSRKSTQAATIVIDSHSPFCDFLRSGSYGKLISFILRHAAVQMHPKALGYFDATLEGYRAYGKENPLVILDQAQHNGYSFLCTENEKDACKIIKNADASQLVIFGKSAGLRYAQLEYNPPTVAPRWREYIPNVSIQ